MKEHMLYLRVLLAFVVILSAGQSTLLAQTGTEFDLTWSSIDGGGKVSSSITFTAQGTVGQPDAVRLFGDTTLQGGFWGLIFPPSTSGNVIFSDDFESGDFSNWSRVQNPSTP